MVNLHERLLIYLLLQRGQVHVFAFIGDAIKWRVQDINFVITSLNAAQGVIRSGNTMMDTDQTQVVHTVWLWRHSPIQVNSLKITLT